MKERLSILMRITPSYGEILLGVGSIALTRKENLLDDEETRNRLKEFLINRAPLKRTLPKVLESSEFKSIILEKFFSNAQIEILKDDVGQNKIVNIYLADFFRKSIWPILVRKYIDNICEGIRGVNVSINVKKNAYVTICGDDDPQKFFKEFKEYLLYNYIIISKAEIKQNGDMLVNLVIPIPDCEIYGNDFL